MSGSEGGGIETNRCFLPLYLLSDPTLSYIPYGLWEKPHRVPFAELAERMAESRSYAPMTDMMLFSAQKVRLAQHASEL
jgi:hypothetical protein